MENKNFLYELKSIKSDFLLSNYNHYISKKHFLIILILFYFTFEQSKISLIIKGTGPHNFLNETINFNPTKAIINDVEILNPNKTYNFVEELNNVTIIFNEPIYSCTSMFERLSNIIEIDLSNLDSSKVISMTSMFRQCSSLKKIIFGNINTSSVTTMDYLFYFCKHLTSIDLSKFNTSSVITMERMFSHCESLSSLDVSSFNTKNVVSMFDIFAYCYNLTSNNVSSFDTSKV